MQPSELATERDFSDWLQHPVTKLLRTYLEAKREGLKNQWAQGEFTYQEGYATAIKNAEAIGACVVYSDLLELEYEDIAGDSDAK